MYKNHIDLIGFIGSDPEARQTSNGTAVTTLSLATKSSWKNELGLRWTPIVGQNLGRPKEDRQRVEARIA